MTVAWKPSMAIPVVVAVTGERHDKHAGERQGKPFRKHAKIRKAPFRLPLTYVNGQAKSRSFQQSQGMNGFFYTGYRSISR